MMKKIAIPITADGVLDSHFGHCTYFALLSASDGEIISEERVSPPPHEPGLLPRWLAEQGVTDVLAGGMGQKAMQIFQYNEVNVYVGAPRKTAKELAMGFLSGTIEFVGNNCDH